MRQVKSGREVVLSIPGETPGYCAGEAASAKDIMMTAGSLRVIGEEMP